MLGVNLVEDGRRRREDIVNKDEDGLLRRQFNSLPNHINELSNCQITRDEIFLLINSRNIALHLVRGYLFSLLHYTRNTVWILLSYTVSLLLPLLLG